MDPKYRLIHETSEARLEPTKNACLVGILDNPLGVSDIVAAIDK